MNAIEQIAEEQSIADSVKELAADLYQLVHDLETVHPDRLVAALVAVPDRRLNAALDCIGEAQELLYEAATHIEKKYAGNVVFIDDDTTLGFVWKDKKNHDDDTLDNSES